MIKKIPGSFELGNCLRYNFLYSNEKHKIGVVLEIKKDLNFAYVVTILTQSLKIETLPYSILEYKIIE